ncbi:4Fe-4S dicluster domain-containing protein [Herbivorax sp. ANBcel31]|uniref:4Fe-4S dicluster domain-containing protein n=1 Tax=Herbivorax sp. ANBcel31 TaxID=3069754 RepID=UPI0027AE319A|nr:4Fe-4S dicluster domain-containing protein [Herbivorax sp. ANBcel31]MDQ2086188.1 4Fe-4S dicluster domain-containing protein [Herbivorax sp. ANBcel31]
MNKKKSYKKRIYVNEKVCVGCRLCEIHCIGAHSEYKDNLIKAFKKSSQRPVARIVVEEKKPVSFGLQCKNCDEPECVKACITGAMQIDLKNKIVTNDEQRCIGCWTCILSCPYGAIKRDYKDKKIASKCDFCIEKDGEPQCVKNCPNEALYMEEVDSSFGINEGGV